MMDRFSDLVHDIYDAAFAPEAWTSVLSGIGRYFGGRGATIIFFRENQRAEFIYPPELETAVNLYLEEKWWDRDVHALRAIERHMTSGDVLSDQSLVSPEEIETLPIYTDFFRRAGFGWIMSNVMLPELDMFVGLTVVRAKDRGPFSASEIAELRAIGRHVEQALRISMRLANLGATQNILLAVLDQIQAAIYLLGEDGSLLLENGTGERPFADHFAVLDGRVVARDPAARDRLEELIDVARRAPDPGLVPRSCVLSSDDGTRIVVWAMPLSGSQYALVGLGRTAKVLLLTLPLERGRLVDPVVLRDAFDLSLGEARLAALVGAGRTVREAADELGVTEGTARVVLKRVFAKLGVNRQAELVLRLSTLGLAPGPRAPG